MCEIQILLDKGKSIRSIASMVDIAESTIRSWIIKKLLMKVNFCAKKSKKSPNRLIAFAH